MKHSLVIGTRGSLLARWQANYVAEQLCQRHPALEVSTKIIHTTGDKTLDVPLSEVGGKGVFVKEIEEALLKNEIDLAVHSMKDVPTEIANGLTITAIPRRANPHDAWISERYAHWKALPAGAVVGTSSLRRQCQLLALNSSLRVTLLRGNVDTRLRKLVEGQYDAIVLAAAGLERLGYADRIRARFSVDECVPAVAQGALGIEIRESDSETRTIVMALHDEATAYCVRAERAFLATLGGNCHVPVAAYAELDGDTMFLRGLIGHPSGNPLLRSSMRGVPTNPEKLGTALAQTLLEQGGREILSSMS